MVIEIRNPVRQWRRLGFDPFMYLSTLDGAEIKPGKHPYTRIKPLPLIKATAVT